MADALPQNWLAQIPGRTVAAIQLALLPQGLHDPDMLPQAQAWLGEGQVLALIWATRWRACLIRVC